MQGELKLYRAVMLQAAQDIADSNLSGDPDRNDASLAAAVRSHQSALRWLDDEADYPFSFRNCCQVLGFDPRCTRKSLMRLAGLKTSGRRAFFSAALEGLA